MKLFSNKALHVNRNVMREGAKEILRKKQRNIYFSVLMVLICMVSSGIFMQSCSNENDSLSNVATIDSQEANMIASKYLELKDDQYVLNLSEKEAISLGISMPDYMRMQSEILRANAFIESAKRDPNTSISLTNPQEIKTKKIRLKTGSESTFQGSISPLPSPGASKSLSIPFGISSVKFSYSGPALINTAILTINTGYGTQSVSFISSLSFSDDETVNVPASPAVWSMRAVLYQGSGTISYSY